MLLCDAAEESGGKLYILGGGWSVIRVPEVPTSMALAIKMSIPWDQANQPHQIIATLLTEDGDPVEQDAGPVIVEAQAEIGRPAGIKPGTPLDMPFVLKFQNLMLKAGGYVWELDVAGTTMARAPFRVLEAP